VKQTGALFLGHGIKIGPWSQGLPIVDFFSGFTEPEHLKQTQERGTRNPILL
jgi:hypothetical protein